MPNLITVQDAADALKVDPQTIRRYIKGGRLKAHKLNKRDLRIFESDLQAFINQIAADQANE